MCPNYRPKSRSRVYTQSYTQSLWKVAEIKCDLSPQLDVLCNLIYSCTFGTSQFYSNRLRSKNVRWKMSDEEKVFLRLLKAFLLKKKCTLMCIERFVSSNTHRFASRRHSEKIRKIYLFIHMYKQIFLKLHPYKITIHQLLTEQESIHKVLRNNPNFVWN